MILRYSSPSIIMLGGVPGVGKSTLLDHIDLDPQQAEIVSADECRGRVQMMHDEPYHAYVEERIPEARDDFFRALDSASENEKNIVCEAAYLTHHSRNEIIRWAQQNQYEVHLIVLYTSLEAIREAQNSRERRVPEEILLRHWENWERLADELDDSVLDDGLSTAIMLDRTEVDCLDSIRFNEHT